jgi:hypothetical protein
MGAGLVLLFSLSGGVAYLMRVRSRPSRETLLETSTGSA